MPEPKPLTSRIKKFGIWLAPALFLLTLFGWALSSPVGSSPDDDFHVASIWCAYGDREGLCESSDAGPQEKLVPSSIVKMTCYAFHPQVGGECQNGTAEEEAADLLPVNHGNWNGASYPPVFYGFFGMFASQNIAVSVMAIRLVNAVIATVLLTATAIALPRRLRPMLLISSALALVPLGLSMLPSTNPSSWALLSAATLFPAVYALAETRGKQRLALIVIALVATLMGAGARADAAAYAVLATLLALFLSAGWNKISLAVGAVIFVASVTFYLGSGQSGAIGGLSPELTEGPSTSISLLISNFTHLPGLWLGMFTGLGWLDTAISPIAIFAMVFSAIAVLFTALAKLNARKAIALTVVTLAFVCLPLLILQTSGAAIGTQVQARYVLPLFVMVLAVALVPSPDAQFAPAFSRTQLWLLAGLVVAAQALALFNQLSRYIADAPGFNLDNGTWWWSGSPVSAMGALLISTLSFALLVFVLTRHYERGIGKTVNEPVAQLSN